MYITLFICLYFIIQDSAKKFNIAFKNENY